MIFFLHVVCHAHYLGFTGRCDPDTMSDILQASINIIGNTYIYIYIDTEVDFRLLGKRKQIEMITLTLELVMCLKSSSSFRLYELSSKRLGCCPDILVLNYIQAHISDTFPEQHYKKN